MSQATVLTLFVVWLFDMSALLFGCILMIISLLLTVRPDQELSFGEVFVPLWCLLAGREQRERLRAILARRAASSRDLSLSRFIDILGV